MTCKVPEEMGVGILWEHCLAHHGRKAHKPCLLNDPEDEPQHLYCRVFCIVGVALPRVVDTWPEAIGCSLA